MKILIYFGGIYHLAFALFHLGFWKLFDWKHELQRQTFINRNVIQILNLCLTFVFFAFAWISFTHADALLNADLGRTLLAIIALFWALRAIEQIVFFGVRNAVSLAFLFAFVAGTALYATPLLLSNP